MISQWAYTVAITITPGNHLQLRDAMNEYLYALKNNGLIKQAVWQLKEQTKENDARTDVL